MKRFTLHLAGFVLPLAGALYLTQARSEGPLCYTGMCDASAVVSLDNDFLAVADDEQSVLRVYSRHQGGAAMQSLNLAPFLGLPRRAAEVDLEGAARLGDRIYWISSHGCNAEGKEQLSRRRFFATTGSISNGVIDLRPIGRPYAGLLDDMVRDPRLAAFDLAAAARRAPKTTGALNIEGLCGTPEGSLLIGFRNPIPGGKALIVTLLNPAEVIEGKSGAKFGDPLLVDLGGLGIRSLAWRHDRYWIVAGSYDNESRAQVFEWGGGEDQPFLRALPQLEGLTPEAIAFFADAGGDQVWVASDDGTVKIGGVECKRLKNSRQKRFRAVSVSLNGPMTALR